MADFLDPTDAASQKRLADLLNKRTADIEGALQRSQATAEELTAATREASAARVTEAREFSAVRRPGGTPRSTVAEATDATAAIRQQAAAEGDVNAQIVRNIELQKQAALAARQTAVATQEGIAGAAARVQGAAMGVNPATIEAQAQRVAAMQALAAKNPPPRTPEQLAAAAGRVQAAGVMPVAASPGAISQSERKVMEEAAAPASKLSARQQELAATAATASQREVGFAQSVELASRQMSISSTEYSRHGAMTTEFIRAAAAGQVTVRDLGNEMLLTLGKFGGWTAAAGLTYGAVRALGAVKEGALEASTGVQQLTRFLPDLNKNQAFDQIAGQATKLNVPIKDVTDASMAFARIFKNQNDVMTASHVALLATKLDNIDLADSYRYLTSLTQEYGLSADQLPGVFDQISAAQRELGARVSEVFPALARSAAAVKNAGGNLNQLLAEVALTIVRTGQTGSSVGTAFYRGASNPQAFNRPANQAYLKSIGIDPAQGFTQALAQGIALQGLSGADRRRTSAAFFGNQFGGRFASIIGAGPDVLNQFMQKTSPGASRGSAQLELNKVLDSANEKLKALGVQAQVFGAELARSGALVPLGAMVSGLTEALKLINGLTAAIAELPGGVGHVLIPLGEVLTILRLMQRFNLGSIFPGAKAGTGVGGFLSRPGILAPSANTQMRVDIGKGIDEQGRYFTQLASQTAIANTKLSSEVLSQNRYVAYLNATGAEQDEIIAAEAKLQQLTAQSAQLAFREATARATVNEVDAQRLVWKENMARGMGAEQAAIEAGMVARPGTISRNRAPLGTPVALVDEQAGARATTVAAQAELDAVLLSQGTTEAEIAARDALSEAKLNEAKVFQADAVATAAGAEANAAVTAAATEAGVSADIAAESTALSTSRLARTRGAISGKVIPGLIGLSIAYELIKSGLDEQNQAQQAVDQASEAFNRTASISQANAANDQLAKAAKTKDRAEALGPFGALGAIPGVGSAAEWLQRQVGTQQFSQDTLKARALQELIAPISTRKVPMKPFGINLGPLGTMTPGGDSFSGTRDVTTGGAFTMLLKQADDDGKHVKNTLSARKEWYQELDALKQSARHLATQREQGQSNEVKAAIEHAYDVTVNDLQTVYATVQQRFKQLPNDARQAFLLLQQTDPKQIGAEIGVDADRVKLFGANRGTMRGLADRYNDLAYRFAGSNNADELALLSQAQSGFDGAIKQSMTDLSAQAQATSDPGQRRALLAQARAVGQRALADLSRAQGSVDQDVAGKRATYDAAIRKLAAAQGVVAQESDPVKRAIEQLIVNSGGMQQAVAKAYAEWIAASRHARGSKTVTKASATAIQQQLQLLTQGTNDPEELYKLREQIAQARATGDPVRQAQIAVEIAQHDKKMATTTKARLQAELDLLNADTALTQARMDIISQEGQITQAQLAGDATAQAAAAISNAARETAAATNPEQHRRARLDTINAQNQAWQAGQDRASMLAQIQQTQAEHDPAKQAEISMRLAQHEMATARGESDRLKAELDLAKAENDLAKARQTRIDASYDLRISQTQDPVKQAQLELAKAESDARAIERHGGANTPDAQIARGRVNDARNKLRDQQLSGKEDTIQFNLDMNNISTETAISQYQALLKIHGITTQARRQILEKIKQLKDAGNSEFGALDLGSIRLPTPYEIRRAVLAAQAGVNVTNHYSTQIQVTDERSAAQVGVQMDRWHAGTGKAIQRATASR